MAGRPTLLDETVHLAMVAYAKDGIAMDVSAHACGLGEETAEQWYRKGKREWREWTGDDDPEVGTHAAFYREVRRAQALWEIAEWKNAREGDAAGVGNGKGKSAQWALERTKGRRYQPKIALQVQNEMSVVIDVVMAVLSAEAAAEVLEAIGDLDDDGIPRVLSAGGDDVATH